MRAWKVWHRGDPDSVALVTAVDDKSAAERFVSRRWNGRKYPEIILVNVKSDIGQQTSWIVTIEMEPTFRAAKDPLGEP